MHWIAKTALILGTLSFLAGYLRFITDENGHVNLNNYRFTGGLGMVLTGFASGVRDLLAREWSGESTSALLMIGGLALAALGVWAA